MYEYKPVVHQDPFRVDLLAMLEMLLQAHYRMRFYKIPVMLHCLTDLITWHYFKTSLNRSTSKFTIEWWHRIDGNDPLTDQELVEHTKFIVREVSVFCSDS